jgi:hypothetical protein
MFDLVRVKEQFKSKQFKNDKLPNLRGRAIIEALLKIQWEAVHPV